MKKINFARIMQRLITKLKLSDYSYEPFVMSETVRLVVDLNELTRILKTIDGTVAVTATGAKTLFTAPVGKRYRVKSVHVALFDGTWTWNNLGFKDDQNADPAILAYYSTSLATEKVELFPQDMFLEEGDSIQINVDVKTVNGNLLWDALVEEEDIS